MIISNDISSGDGSVIGTSQSFPHPVRMATASLNGETVHILTSDPLSGGTVTVSCFILALKNKFCVLYNCKTHTPLQVTCYKLIEKNSWHYEFAESK